MTSVPTERQASGPPEQERLAQLRRELNRAVGSVCPGWLANRRDEIVQSALVQVWRSQGKGEGIRQLPASYLWRAAYTAVAMEIRRLRRRRESPLETAGAASTLPAGGVDPERRAAGREAGRAIADCLGRLGEPRRLAVTFYLQGHTVTETSTIVGWSAKKAENLVYRGLADLRRCLREKGLDP